MTPRNKRLLSLGTLASLALLFSGCASTEMDQTWTSPDVHKFDFEKVFVIANTQRDRDRFYAENAIAKQITRVHVIRSFEVFEELTDLGDKERVIQGVKDSGADAVVVLRFKNADSEVSRGQITTRPMDYASSFSDYYGGSYYYGTSYDVSAFYATDARSINISNVFYFEVKIFDVETESLLWSGTTRSSFDDSGTPNIEGVITKVAKAVKSALQDEGLVR